MLACNYHTYKDFNNKEWVWWDAFNIPLSNTETIIYDMKDKIDDWLYKEWLISIFRNNDDTNWDLRQSYDIYDYVNWFWIEEYINEWNYVWFGFIKLKES